MIYNRTQSDLDNAIAIRAEKVQKFEQLSEDDIAILEKGFITINTLNRIEEKQQDLKGIFNDMGYWNVDISNKEWYADMIFNETDFERILNNLNVLRKAFFVYSNTPQTPPISYHYEDINAIEKILYDLDVMINDVKSNYRQCGAYECGEG